MSTPESAIHGASMGFGRGAGRTPSRARFRRLAFHWVQPPAANPPYNRLTDNSGGSTVRSAAESQNAKAYLSTKPGQLRTVLPHMRSSHPAWWQVQPCSGSLTTPPQHTRSQ